MDGIINGDFDISLVKVTLFILTVVGIIGFRFETTCDSETKRDFNMVPMKTGSQLDLLITLFPYLYIYINPTGPPRLQASCALTETNNFFVGIAGQATVAALIDFITIDELLL